MKSKYQDNEEKEKRYITKRMMDRDNIMEQTLRTVDDWDSDVSNTQSQNIEKDREQR